MNPNKDVDRTRLFKAMEWSYGQLDPFRKLVRGLVEEYAGSGYGHDGAKPKFEILVNLMHQTVDAYTMSLVANRPRVMISTKKDLLRYFARQFETAVNNLIEEIKLEHTLRQCVLDAFFCVGIVKIHMGDSAQVQLEEGFWMDPGTPFASNVSIDNWVHDMSATAYHKVRYAGDCYRLPFEDLKNADLFDQSVVKQLQPTSKFLGEEDRLERISVGYETDQDELEPMIDLMDVWVPRDEKIYTFPMDPTAPFSGKFKPVADMVWDGPEFGPYHILSFNDVPENVMPTSPASHLAGMARLVNNIMRKQSRRARQQKDVVTYTPSAANDARKIERSDDLQYVGVTDPNEINVMKIGGVDGPNQAFMLGLIEMYDRMAGNLKAMAGLGPQADTFGQEQIIAGAVSKREAQMQYRVVDHAVGVIRDLGYMLWHDAAKVIPGRIPVQGANQYSIDATWTPEDREGDFFDYNMDIDLFSMPYQSPTQRVQSLLMVFKEIYGPMAPLIAAQGGQINMRKVNEIFADLLNQPHLKEILQFTAAVQQGGPEGPAPTPAQTTRNYVRRSVPTQGTPQGRSHVEQQAWLSRNEGPRTGGGQGA